MIAALDLFWTPSSASTSASQRLATLFASLQLPAPTHEPFAGDREFPHHPELLQLSWTLYPVVDLDADRHAGALRAMEEAHEEVDVSAPVDQEGPELGVQELTQGAPRGVLVGEFLLWADGPYAYNDYIFRGASKAAKLLDPPEGALENNEEDSGGYVDT